MIGQSPIPFVFIHPPKTAGTSVEQFFLGRWYGIGDFTQSNSDIGNKHWCDPCSTKMHAGLASYEKEFGDLSNYFVFTIVRNPWDWRASFVTWVSHLMPARNSFKDNLRLFCRKFQHAGHFTRENQVDYHQGSRPIDYYIRFESIEEGWADVCGRMGIPHSPLPITRFRPDKLPYPHYYDDESRELVAQVFARDIEKFGYTFNPDHTTTSPPEAAQ